MKKLVLAMFVFVSCFASKAYSDGHGIKMGIILGFTGPIESLTPAMAASAELALKKLQTQVRYLVERKFLLKEQTQLVLTQLLQQLLLKV